MRAVILCVLLLVATCAAAELPSASEVAVRQALAAGKPLLLDLGSRSCVSCREMAPILEELAATYRGKASVLFIDVREDQAAASRFGIRMIPTQIFFDAQGQEIKRHIGVLERPALVEGLRAAGAK